MRAAGLQEGAEVHLYSAFALPGATFCKLKARDPAFHVALVEMGPKEFLEAALRGFSVLSEGQSICVEFGGAAQLVDVVETRPTKVVSVLGNVDVEVEFEAPPGVELPARSRTPELLPEPLPSDTEPLVEAEEKFEEKEEDVASAPRTAGHVLRSDDLAGIDTAQCLSCGKTVPRGNLALHEARCGRQRARQPPAEPAPAPAPPKQSTQQTAHPQPVRMPPKPALLLSEPQAAPKSNSAASGAADTEEAAQRRARAHAHVIDALEDDFVFRATQEPSRAEAPKESASKAPAKPVAARNVAKQASTVQRAPRQREEESLFLCPYCNVRCADYEALQLHAFTACSAFVSQEAAATAHEDAKVEEEKKDSLPPSPAPPPPPPRQPPGKPQQAHRAAGKVAARQASGKSDGATQRSGSRASGAASTGRSERTSLSSRSIGAYARPRRSTGSFVACGDEASGPAAARGRVSEAFRLWEVGAEKTVAKQTRASLPAGSGLSAVRGIAARRRKA